VIRVSKRIHPKFILTKFLTQYHYIRMASYRLRDLIFKGVFFDISDDALLVQRQEEFAPDLERLANAKFIQGSAPVATSVQSPSQLLYGKDHDEINRTLVGVLALRWIKAGDHERFVGSQENSVKLSAESFQRTQNLFADGVHSHDDLYALVMSLMIDDLGKDPNLARDYEKKTGKSISGLSHGRILSRAVDIGLLSCIQRLPQQQRGDLMLGLRIGAGFNFGQLARAENVPACLEGLKAASGHERAFEMKFMQQILKIAGARGHEDHTCARRLTESIFQAHRLAYEVATNIISGKWSVREGYDGVLMTRAQALRNTEFRPLVVEIPAERALLRLLCMGSAVSKPQAELFVSAFYGLPASMRERLIASLNRDGAVGKPAVHPTHMPAMFALGLSNTLKASEKKRKWWFLRSARIERNAKVRALKSLLRYLARVLEVKELPQEPVTVIERDVMEIKTIIQSSAFKKSPEILDKQSVPKDGFATLARAGKNE
jgi:hypothetical protein